VRLNMSGLVVVATTLGAVVAAVGQGQVSPAVLQAVADARQLLREDRASAALELLTSAGLNTPRVDVPAQPGVLAQAALGAGKPELAQAALGVVLQDETLKGAARSMAQLRALEACGLGCPPAAVEVPPITALPLAAQTRWLRALRAAGNPAARVLALELAKAAPWENKVDAPSDRADALAAAWSALREEPKGAARARPLVLWAWENLPTEPAVFPLLATVKDETLTAELGSARAVAHLEALLDGNANEPAVAFGRALCAGAEVDGDKVCPVLKDAALGCRAGFAVGKALRQSRQYPQAEAALSVVAKGCKEQAPRAYFLWGKAAAAQREGTPRAIAAYEAVAQKFPDNRLADDALTQVGQLASRAPGMEKVARKAWEKVLKHHANGDQAPEAAWWLAWDAHARGKDADARPRLDAMKATLEGKATLPWRRALYWRGRLDPEPKAQVAALQDVVSRQPQSYEAALARGTLQRASAEVPPPPPWSVRAPSPAAPDGSDVMVDAALALERAGLDAEAGWLLRMTPWWSVPPLGADGGAATPVDLWLCDTLLRLGDAPYVSRWMRGHHAPRVQGPPTADSARLMQLAYPQAHARALESAAAAEKLPASLLYALAREESAFDARVTSWAGAMGLTQLMPATAQLEAKTLGLPKPSNVAALDPMLNARLGAAHLARHLREFHGNPALALAAYNAGPGHVRTWLRRHGNLPLDEFVERIPLDETRGYVKRVLETWGIYRLLRGEGALSLPASPKDRVLEL
jgi:soluble lytic murein transglycosylase